jgi:N-acetylated-alpha-linked acidic dipeptidase
MLASQRALGFAVLASLSLASTGDDQPIRGFSTQSAKTERQLEASFRAVLAPDSMREAMRVLSARPHHLGSPRDSVNADWLLQRFRSWGWDARIETFRVLFPTPAERVVELVAPSRFRATLKEPALKSDPTTAQQSEQLPTYNAYSIDGDVTAPLVFVNYGLPEDYQRLERLGISVKGAIVIARYGRSWRGIKPKLAAEHGAVGCLIYSDPEGDGYHAGDVYPKGPFRPGQGVQRGSVLDMPLYPGDPLTPGVGATENAKRLARSDAATITKVPVLPLSYDDARPLLAAIGGRPAPQSWAGALPITYHIGPGPARVHLRIKSDWRMVLVRDVIARLPGRELPDQWVVRGNHHDAWVNGAQDPISGLVSLLEEARSIGALVKAGWRPKRTIIYAAWDGEEPVLLGSTEWAETHAEELTRNAVAYINSDANGRGVLNVDGSPTLARMLTEVTQEVIDPETRLSAWKRAHLAAIANAESRESRDRARKRQDVAVDPVGSGSDYTAFYHHLGIPSLNLGFGGEDDGGVYHSIYDSFRWFTTFSDSAFVYGRALAETGGMTVLRLANADLLPFEFTELSQRVGDDLKQVEDLLKATRDSIEEQNRELEESTFVAINDPRFPIVAPAREDVPPHLNYSPLENAADRLKRAADRYEDLVQDASRKSDSVLTGENLKDVNAQLLQAERLLAPAADGLRRRPWYRQVLSAPGWYTGYAPKNFAGVTEGIEEKRWKDSEDDALRIGRALDAEAESLGKTADLLERVMKR